MRKCLLYRFKLVSMILANWTCLWVINCRNIRQALQCWRNGRHSNVRWAGNPRLWKQSRIKALGWNPINPFSWGPSGPFITAYWRASINTYFSFNLCWFWFYAWYCSCEMWCKHWAVQTDRQQGVHAEGTLTDVLRQSFILLGWIRWTSLVDDLSVL